MKKALVVILCILSFCFIGCDHDYDIPESKEQYYYPILNHSFETELDKKVDQEWDYYNYDSTIKQVDDASDGNKAVECSVVVDGYISVWQVIPIENKEYATKFATQYTMQKALIGNGFDKFPENNDDVNFSVDLKVSSDVIYEDPSLIKIQVKAENKRKVSTIIAESNLTKIDYDKWFTLSTKPLANDGFIPDDSVLIVVSIMADLPEGSKLYFDNARCYSTKKSSSSEQQDNKDYEYYDDKGSLINIEDYSFENATSLFKVNGLEPTIDTVGYYGNKSILVQSGQKASYYTSLQNANVKNRTLCAGVYAFIKDVENNHNGMATIVLKGKINNEMVTLASTSTEVANKWVYLKTPLIDPRYISSQITNIEVQLLSVGNDCDFDVIQIGDIQAVNGNPEKFAILAYQPWFQCKENSWGNWQYDSTMAGGRNYNPNNIINVDGVERRDIASVYYPAIGVYDSTDIEVLNYHVDLIKAMNIDCIQVNYYGSLATAQYQLDVFDNLVTLCEQKDLKISLLYEPKIHLNGWIPHSSREQSINGIISDLVDFVNKYQNCKALLRYNGRFVIEAFGLNLLKGNEWTLIKTEIEKQTGEKIFLMGDGISSNDYSSIDSMFQWSLYTSSLETADQTACIDYCKLINSKVSEWVEANEFTKKGVGIVYPGFDDTPVRSWSSQPNGKIRKIGRTGLDFYTDSWNTFKEEKAFDWVIIATFNDWTEGTVIEPSVQNGHRIAYKTYEEVSKFKGISDIKDITYLEEITSNYLNNRITNYK